MFASFSDNSTNLQHVKRCKTCVLGLNALFRGTKVVKHPFKSIGPKMMFWSVSWHFANLGHVKDAKLVFEPECTISGYKVVMHPFKSIGPKMVYGSVSEHFANPWQVKHEKLVFRARMQYFGLPKLWSIHSSPLDPKWCLEVFRSISQTVGM
jgi:hypothetical protein